MNKSAEIALTARRHRFYMIVPILLILAGMGWILLETRQFFMLLGAITMLLLLREKQYPVEYAMTALLLWFAAGYRAYDFAGFRIHMLDLLILLLAFQVLTHRGNNSNYVIDSAPLESSVLFRILFFSALLYGFVLAFVNDVNILRAASNMKHVFLLAPLLYAVNRIRWDGRMIDRTMWSMLAAGIIISIPGILEYNAGIFAEGSSYGDGFNRALFSFWGAPMAVLVVTLCFQAHWYLWARADEVQYKLFVLASALLQMYAIYISGTRNMWIAVLSTTVFAVYLRYGFRRSLLIVPLGVFLLTLAPEEGVQRMQSFYFLHEHDQYGRDDTRWLDSSGAKRVERMNTALAMIASRPWGSGWAASGWVHSDVVSIAADLGILFGLVFVVLLLRTTLRTLAAARRAVGRDKWLWITFSGFMLTNINLFGFGGVTWLAQYAVPAWFTWLLTHVMLKRRALEHEA